MRKSGSGDGVQSRIPDAALNVRIGGLYDSRSAVQLPVTAMHVCQSPALIIHR